MNYKAGWLWVLMFVLALIAAGAEPPQGIVPQPSDGVKAAYLDIQTLPLQEQQYQRYLWRGTLNAKEWELHIIAIRGIVQALSRESDLPPVAVVGDQLVRINYTDYGWPHALWEKLADDDVVFHARTEISEDEYEDVRYGERDGKGGWKNVEVRREKTGRTKGKRTATVNLAGDKAEDALAVAGLVKLTQSQAPILPLDWWISATGIQEGREGHGYYDFLGIKNRRDIERLGGFDRNVAKGGNFTDLREAISESGIAQQPRRIESKPGYKGRLWVTNDNKNKAIGQNNPLEVLNGGFEHIAEELIVLKANGFPVMALAKADQKDKEEDGKLQNTAPDFVGFLKSDVLIPNDVKIHGGIVGCADCHYNKARDGGSGLMNMDGWARGIFSRRQLLSPDPVKLKELRQEYQEDIASPLIQDRQTHERAVWRATSWIDQRGQYHPGVTADKWASAYVSAFGRYEYYVDLRRASAMVGVTPDQFKTGVEAIRVKTGFISPIQLAGLIDGKRIGIRQFEDLFLTAFYAARGVVLPAGQVKP